MRAGVVLVPPFGHEHVHSYRTLLHVADQLADRGLLALRFDPYASGSSPGDWSSDNLVTTWVQDVRAALNLVAETTGGRPSLLGVRLGAPIASIATGEVEVENLVLWEPVLKGRRHIREAQALSGLSLDADPEPKPYIAAAGFVISDETADGIKRLDMLARGPRVANRVLIVERDDFKEDHRLRAALEDSGIGTDVVRQPGYVEMMAEPHDTIVPKATVGYIADWLDENTTASDEVTVPAAIVAEEPYTDDEGWSETFVTLPTEDPLFGVLTMPAESGEGRPPLLVLSNAGSVHQIGPNRLYVQLARALAREGFATFRFDLRNLGDSLRPGHLDENHPYPKSAGQDTDAAVVWLRDTLGFDRIVLAGLCSGAHTAFHAAAGSEADGIVGSLLVNPLTFDWMPGMSLAIPRAYQAYRDWTHYRRSVRSFGSWRRLIVGRVNVRYIVTFVVRWVRAGAVGPTNSMLERLGLRKPSKLGQDLARIVARGRTVDFVFARSDPGYRILTSDAGPTVKRLTKSGQMSVGFIDKADHTFTGKDERDELVDQVLAVLRRRFDA